MSDELIRELKPCPFCGSTDIVSNYGDLLYCKNCWIESTKLGWNMRPLEDKLEAKIAELEAMTEKLIKAGNDLTINPSVGNYEEREAAWTKLWLEWKDGKK